MKTKNCKTLQEVNLVEKRNFETKINRVVGKHIRSREKSILYIKENLDQSIFKICDNKVIMLIRN